MHDQQIQYNEIVDKYYEKIYAYCMLKLQNEAEAKDITQNVFFALSQCYTKSEIIDINQWLYSVAKKQVALYYREQYKRHDIISYNGYDEEKLNYTYDPCDTISDMELAQLKEKILSSLTEKEHQLYHEVYVEKLQYEYIAKNNNISEQTLRKRISRLRKKMIGYIKALLYCFTIIGK